jgi:hypothetical protein
MVACGPIQKWRMAQQNFRLQAPTGLAPSTPSSVPRGSRSLVDPRTDCAAERLEPGPAVLARQDDLY